MEDLLQVGVITSTHGVRGEVKVFPTTDDVRRFKKLKEANEILGKDPETKKLVDEFLQLSQEIEIAKYQGQEPEKEKTEKLQKLYGVLGLNRDAMEYLNNFMRFQMMMADISKSIQDVVKDVMGDK